MTTDPAQAIVDLMQRGSLAQAAYVAAELGLADHLAAGPMQANELALRHQLSPTFAASPFASTGDARNLR